MNDLKLLGMTLTLALATVACTDDGELSAATITLS